MGMVSHPDVEARNAIQAFAAASEKSAALSESIARRVLQLTVVVVVATVILIGLTLWIAIETASG